MMIEIGVILIGGLLGGVGAAIDQTNGLGPKEEAVKVIRPEDVPQALEWTALMLTSIIIVALAAGLAYGSYLLWMSAVPWHLGKVGGSFGFLFACLVVFAGEIVICDCARQTIERRCS